MKFFLSLVALMAICQITLAGRYNITCFYDTSSVKRGGFANFTETDLKTSLEYCTHIVYGFVDLHPKTYELENSHTGQNEVFAQVKKLKTQYRNIKFLLSLGGSKDKGKSEKYMKLLAAPGHQQDRFISSVEKYLHKYRFDGLDLAYQFPLKGLHESKIKKVLHKVKDTLGKNHLAKKIMAATHLTHGHGHGHDHALGHGHGHGSQKDVPKQQFTALVNKLKNALSHDKLMLTLTVLPNVNASTYINIPAIMGYVDFVNLGTFDYSNPQRTPHQADYLAPLFPPARHGKHVSAESVDTDVHHWISAHMPPYKLNMGIPTYARSWKMTKALKSTNLPIHGKSLGGAALGGELTRTPGLLSWPETCSKLSKMSKNTNKKYGNYAYRSPNVKGHDGLFITYEDQDSLAEKAAYVHNNNLGGVAIFDLTLDDFRDKCKQGKFPALKTLKFKLV